MDLKPPNVLLHDKNYLVAKIADLGLSRQIAEGSSMTNYGHGFCTCPYMTLGPLLLFSCTAANDACYGSNIKVVTSGCGRTYR